VITASEDATARVWDAGTGRAIGPPLPHNDAVYVARFDPDQQWIMTAGVDQTVRLWRAPTAIQGTLAQVVLWAQVCTGMELDPAGGMQVLDAAAWQQRRQCLQDSGGPLAWLGIPR